MHKWYLGVLVAFHTLLAAPINAQLWECRPTAIFTVGGKILINRTSYSDTTFTFDTIPLESLGNLNSMGHRKSDNCLYGIDGNLGERRLFRLSPDGEYEILRSMGGMRIDIGGSISWDDNYLILNNTTEIIWVNLDEVDSIRIVPLIMQDEEDMTFNDFAIHPINGRMCGFSPSYQRYWEINPSTGEILKRQALANADIHIMSTPAIGIDDRGLITALTSKNGMPAVSFYDPIGGRIVNEAPTAVTLPPSIAADGASCIPEQVRLSKYVFPDTVYNCRRFRSTLLFSINDPLIDDYVCVLADSFPPGFVIEEVLYNQYGGTIEGIGTNVLHIRDLSLVYGIDSIVLSVSVPDGIAAGSYFTQCKVEGLEGHPLLPSGVLRSDDLKTYWTFADATLLNVARFGEAIYTRSEHFLCPGTTIELGEWAYGFSYQWENGDSRPTRVVGEAGTYNLTRTDNCRSYITDFMVRESSIIANIAGSRFGRLGDALSFDADIVTAFPLLSAYWAMNDIAISPVEAIVLSTTVTLSADGTLSLNITDSIGCQARYEAELKAKFSYYAPSAFSPNGDGANDVFYIQTGVPVALKSFKVFNRWGGLVFERFHQFTNDPTEGWDGNYLGSGGEMGAYIWLAEIGMPNTEETELISGEVLLIR